MINVYTGTHVTASTAMNEAREEAAVRIGILSPPVFDQDYSLSISFGKMFCRESIVSLTV